MMSRHSSDFFVILSFCFPINQMVTEHVLQESTAVPETSEHGVPLGDSNAVYVAIDPSQADVQQILGQIQAITSSQLQQAQAGEQSHDNGQENQCE